MVSKIKTQGGPGGKLGLSVSGSLHKPPGTRQGGPGGKLDRGLHPPGPRIGRGLFAIARQIVQRAEVIAHAAPHANDLGSSGDHRNHENRFTMAGCGVNRGGTSGQEENAQIRVGNSTGSSTRNSFSAVLGRDGIAGVLQKLSGWFGKP